MLTAAIIGNRRPTTAVQHMTHMNVFMQISQMFLTSESLHIQSMYICQMKNEKSGILSQ